MSPALAGREGTGNLYLCVPEDELSDSHFLQVLGKAFPPPLLSSFPSRTNFLLETKCSDTPITNSFSNCGPKHKLSFYFADEPMGVVGGR